MGLSKKEAIGQAKKLADQIGNIFGNIHVVKFKHGWEIVTDDYFKKYKKRKIHHTVRPELKEDIGTQEEVINKLKEWREEKDRVSQ